MSDKFFAQLTDTLLSADPLELELLAIELRDYTAKFGRTMAGVRKQPFANKLLAAIEEAAS